MNGFWYRLLTRSATLCGPWLFVVTSRIIATGFFIFSGRTAESIRFYALLHPHKGRLHHLMCTFRQYQNFTTIHLDRFLQDHVKSATFTSTGWERLKAVIGQAGGILLMSHLGNWEMAATLLKKQKKDLQLLLYMGVKEKEGVERVQKEDLRRSGVRIIGVDQTDNSPLAAVAALQTLRAGGLVSMAGDIVWRSDQRKVAVDFLGRRAHLPEAPFVFSLLSGAPLFVFFAFRRGENDYHVSLAEPIFVTAPHRQDRAQAISRAAQQYALLLEQALRQHPFEWYHFDRFVH